MGVDTRGYGVVGLVRFWYFIKLFLLEVRCALWKVECLVDGRKSSCYSYALMCTEDVRRRL